MGRQKEKKVIPFTKEYVLDKELVINMLQFEEEFTKSNEGQDLYRNPLNRPYVSLHIEKTINRIVLNNFGFNTLDESVEMYRTIFKTYFNSPDDYDEDVINSVHYMRENKCVFYKHPKLKIGAHIPDCTLYNLDGETETTLYNAINKHNFNKVVIAAFSLS